MANRPEPLPGGVAFSADGPQPVFKPHRISPNYSGGSISGRLLVIYFPLHE
ncbi:hypothetical protein Hsw_3860 [Hymenobacter swuensis DY53]|uniref:Uncharacterized protein n=1 Tax=Hymenobacter swuensis DY53 TaxID=1227739 RepID=W8FCR1_9BACT|nr:hypothetical protein Hsw_3860 [Hymenobacter swuensis DY53]